MKKFKKYEHTRYFETMSSEFIGLYTYVKRVILSDNILLTHRVGYAEINEPHKIFIRLPKENILHGDLLLHIDDYYTIIIWETETSAIGVEIKVNSDKVGRFYFKSTILSFLFPIIDMDFQDEDLVKSRTLLALMNLKMSVTRGDMKERQIIRRFRLLLHKVINSIKNNK